MSNYTKIDILVVEDDGDMRDFVAEVLSDAGYSVSTAQNGVEALDKLGEKPFPIVVSDLKMPVMDGITLLEKINARDVVKPFVILITAFGDVDQAVQLIKRGAREVYAMVAHGVLGIGSIEQIDASPIKKLLITDSIENQPVTFSNKIEVVSVAPLFGNAIKRIHNRDSISEMFE